MIRVDFILDWVSTPYKIHSYSNFTNPKFELVSRTDSFFFQTTKDFFILNLPLLTISTFIFNRLFYCFFNYKISLILQIYSLWLQLVVLLIVENVSMLVFLICSHFTHLFAFETLTYLLQGITVAIIGMMIVFGGCFYLLCTYLCGRLNRLFLKDLKNVQKSYYVMQYRFIFKPTLTSIIHMVFYSNPSIQLLLLSLIDLLSFAFLSFVQMKYNIYTIKS